MNINVKTISRVAISFACGFAACLLLLSHRYVAQQFGIAVSSPPTLAYTQVGRPMFHIVLPPKEMSVMVAPEQNDPLHPISERRFLDLIDSRAQPDFKLDTR